MTPVDPPTTFRQFLLSYTFCFLSPYTEHDVTLIVEGFVSLVDSLHFFSFCIKFIYIILSCSFHVACMSINFPFMVYSFPFIFLVLMSFHIPFSLQSCPFNFFHGVLMSFHISFILHLCPFMSLSFCIHVLSCSFHAPFILH